MLIWIIQAAVLTAYITHTLVMSELGKCWDARFMNLTDIVLSYMDIMANTGTWGGGGA